MLRNERATKLQGKRTSEPAPGNSTRAIKLVITVM
jgi:hypothetical protein